MQDVPLGVAIIITGAIFGALLFMGIVVGTLLLGAF